MIGRQIGHYRIIEELGAGAMGVVYKAEDLDLKVTRALKFLPPQTAATDDQLARLQREARAAASLEHPNICPVHEIGREDGQTFIVMSYLKGRTLEDRLAADGPLPVDEVPRIAAQVGSALSRAHAAGVVHRDIKPANIMLTDEGQAVVMDFGLARATDLSRLTKTGTALGTAAYMSPEQANGQSVDAQADVWALGVVLYQMLSGRLPFASDQLAGIFYAIMHKEPEPVTGYRPDAPPDLERIIDRALAKDIGQRYRTADELLSDLEAVRDRQELGQRTARYDRRRKLKRRKRLLFGVLAAVVAAAVALTWWTWYQDANRIDSLAVLPFANLSEDQENDFISEGLTEQLITELQMLGAGSDLRVIGRTTVMRYRDSDLSLPEIAAELDVDAIVEASVRRAGDKVFVTAKLIKANPEQQIWADQFERTEADILKLNALVAGTIGQKLSLEISAESQNRLNKVRPVDPRAYEIYLQGRHLFSLVTLSSVRRAAQMYEEAIKLDPEFSLAYAHLAEAYGMLIQIEPLPGGGEGFKRAMAAANRALEIDETNATAHAVISDVLMYTGEKIDYEKMDWHSQRALELNPSNIAALLYNAQQLKDLDRSDEGVVLLERALALDPYNPFLLANMVFNQDNVDEARVWYERTLEVDPANSVARWAFGWELVKKEKFEEAVQILTEAQDKLFSIEEGSPESLPQLLTALVGLGRTGEIEAIKTDLEAAAERRYIPRVFLACVHGALGNEERAVELMEAAWDEKDFRVQWQMETVEDLIFPEGHPSARFLDLKAKFKSWYG